MSWIQVAFKPLRSLAWRWVKRLVRRKFPAVPSISTTELARWLEDDSPPVLIDARREEEYAVSHLPGARHLQTVAAIAASDISTDDPIVVYCSVGYRSARLAEQLQAAGYSDVHNLEGSIFEWYNQGCPVMANGKSVREIHPYDRTWGLLIEES